MGILPQCGYSIFGIGVDRRQEAKWLFAQQKATLHTPQKVYVYSENALDNISLWGKELKPGSINFFNNVTAVKNVHSIPECTQIRVVVRLQTGREFWLTGQGPGQDGKVVMGRLQRIAFKIRDVFEKTTISIDT